MYNVGDYVRFIGEEGCEGFYEVGHIGRITSVSTWGLSIRDLDVQWYDPSAYPIWAERYVEPVDAEYGALYAAERDAFFDWQEAQAAATRTQVTWLNANHELHKKDGVIA